MERYRNPNELRDGAAFLKKGFCATYTHLRRQVAARINLLIHVQRDGLRVAQVFFRVGFEDSFGEILFIVAAGPDFLALFSR